MGVGRPIGVHTGHAIDCDCPSEANKFRLSRSITSG